MTFRGRVLLASLPLAAALAAWGWWGGVQTVRENQRELSELQARRQRLEEANGLLRQEVVSLRDDVQARERAARTVLDVVAEGEVLVVVPTPSPTAVPTTVGRAN